MSNDEQRQDQDHERIGVECPDCGCSHAPVLYTRDVGGSNGRPGFRRRFRRCRFCGRRFSTRELIEGRSGVDAPRAVNDDGA